MRPMPCRNSSSLRSDSWQVPSRLRMGSSKTAAPRAIPSMRTATSVWLTDIQTEVAVRIEGIARGAAVFDDPILSRDGTCQLSLLSDEEFRQGIGRIRHD